jgi:toluene monooxygenase system protein E
VNDSAGPLTVGGLREISIRSSSWLIPARCSGHFNHDAVQGGRAWLETLQLLFSVTRFPLHGCQRVEAYAAYMAPSSYITNAATFATADLLRRVSLVAYRTAELGIAWPAQGFGAGDRPLWQARPEWQPARELIETALVAYDWGEAFTALNLVIGPTLDDLLLRQLRQAAQAAGDHLT